MSMSINMKLKPIFIGNGFLASGEHPKYYPKDRLIKFLNLNSKNKKAVWEYCRNYSFFPRDIRGLPEEDGWLKGFQKEQKEIFDISKRAANKLLTEKDIRKINRRLKNIHPELEYRDGEEISNMNLDLGGEEFSKDGKEKSYVSTSNQHYGSIVSLWRDLAKHIVDDQDIRQCPRCGQFFEIAPRSHGQKFCTGTNCQNSYNRKKRYHQEKIKNIKI